MRSWRHFIWIKRLLPLIVIFLIVVGYINIKDYLEARDLARDNDLALLTAKVWVASATYRDEPMKFLAYRDSLLAEKGMNREEIFDYIKIYEEKKEQYYEFTKMVSRMVDSLTREIPLKKPDTLSSK